MNSATLFAWLIPVSVGTLCALMFFTRRPGMLPSALGYGSIIGMLLVAAMSSFTARGDTARAWAHAAPSLILLGALVALYLFRRRRALVSPRQSTTTQESMPVWKLLAIAGVFASLALRAWMLTREILLRPTYPWDAWDAWAVKSKAWFLLGHYAPFVSMGDWLTNAGAVWYTGPTWRYPDVLAWMQIWFASAAGGWNEPLVNLPWLALWLGLLAGHYGQWRALGVSRLRATLGVYALGSLPLLDAHVALAGYADLWVATAFGLATLCWLRWLQFRERAQLVLALGFAIALPLLKLEGLVWAVCLCGVIALGMLPVRWRRRAVALALVLFVTLIFFGGHALPFVLLGWVSSGSHAIEIPVIGSLVVAWHADAFYGVVQSLFVQTNWHLLWWFVPIVVFVRWRALRGNEALGLCALLLGTCFALLMFLFLFTDAAQWAESYTAINRLVLHIVPAVISLLVLLLRDAKWLQAPERIAPPSAVPTLPA